MKKVLLLVILLFGHLYALEQKSTLNLYHQILSSLVQKERIKVYTKDKELLLTFRYSKKIIPLMSPDMADVIIVGNDNTYRMIKNRLKRKGKEGQVLFFATNYHLLKTYPSIVGALYWKKGRSQLLFIKKRLQQYSVSLPQEFQHYIIEDI